MAASDSNTSLATPINIPLERSLYSGVILRAVLYGKISLQPTNQPLSSRLTLLETGLEIFTVVTAVYCISHRPPHYRKRQRFYVIYGGILLALSGIQVALVALWGQYMWIDHRNYPGGPLGFYLASQSAWYNVSRFATNAMTSILCDGLLVRPISLRKQLKEWND
jgi:hypothetical protein